MKNTLTLLLIFAASLVWGQAAIEGGGGVCHVSGNPNDVAVLDVQDVRAECFLVVDTTSGALYVYDPTGTIGSRWVIFSGSDGNGIITALPAGNVSIDAAGNQLIIEDAGMYQLQQRSMLEGLANVGVGQQDLATTFGRIYEPGFNTPSTAWFEGLKTGRLHTGIDPWTPNYRVGTWGSLSSGDYAYSGFRWETDTSLYRIRIYAEGNSTAVFRGLEYESDLSANFVDRSLVDKGYVDSRPDADGIYSGSGSLPSDVVVSKAGNSLIISDVGVNNEPFLILDDSTIFKLPSSSAIEFRSDGELIGNIRYVGSTDRFEFAGQDFIFGQTGTNGGRMGLFSPGLADYEILKTDSSLTLNSLTGRVYARKGAGGTVLYPTERPSVASVWQYNSDGTGEMVDVSTLGGGGGAGAYPTVADTTLYTTNQTAVLGETILMDVTSAPLTVTPPASPSQGDRFAVSDARANSGTNNITVDFTTQRILGGAQNYIINSNGAYAEFEYVAPGTGWIPAKPGGGGSGGGGGLPLVTIEEKTADYTIAAADHGKTIGMNDASNIRSFTIPNNTNVPIPIGTRVELTNWSGPNQSQQVRIQYQSGVSRRVYRVSNETSPSDDMVVIFQGVVTATKIGTDQWMIHGDMKTYDAGMP